MFIKVLEGENRNRKQIMENENLHRVLCEPARLGDSAFTVVQKPANLYTSRVSQRGLYLGKGIVFLELAGKFRFRFPFRFLLKTPHYPEYAGKE